MQSKKTTKRTLEEQLYRWCWIFLLIGVPAGICYLWIEEKYFHLPCVLNTFLGIYCPGCGGTRAVHALLKGHLVQSLWYHPLVLYSLVLFLGFFLSHILEKVKFLRIRGWKFHDWYLYGAMGILFGNWILKNALRIWFGIEMI